MGIIEHWLSVPFLIHYKNRKAGDYTGCPAGIEIEGITNPSKERMGKAVDQNIDEIKEACREDVQE